MGLFSGITKVVKSVAKPVTKAVGSVVKGAGNVVSDAVKTVGNVGQKLIDTVKDNPLEAAVLIGAGYYFAPQIGAWLNPATGEAVAGTAAGAPAGAATANLGTGITAGSSGVGLTAGTGAANLASMGGGTGLTTAGAGGGLLSGAGLSTGAAAAGGIGAGIGSSAAASGTGSLLGTAAGTAAGTSAASLLGDAGTAALIKGGLALTGGLLQGDTTKDAAAADLVARTKLAEKAAEMGKFTPVGVTTTFGTSNFVTDPKTGAITPSYTLSPTAAGYQKSLSALGNTALSSSSNIMKLGNQYINESPEAVRQRYIDQQNALVAGSNEQTLAGIRNNLFQTGRTGLATGATSAGNLAATNPEMAAYYNSLANQQRQIAANAETAYQNQVNFGTGLLNSATTPFTNVFNASTGVETAAQKPLELSTNFANTAASRGAANATNYVNTISPNLNTTYNANNYNPWATALSGMSDSDLAVLGLKKLIT